MLIDTMPSNGLVFKFVPPIDSGVLTVRNLPEALAVAQLPEDMKNNPRTQDVLGMFAMQAEAALDRTTTPETTLLIANAMLEGVHTVTLTH